MTTQPTFADSLRAICAPADSKPLTQIEIERYVATIKINATRAAYKHLRCAGAPLDRLRNNGDLKRAPCEAIETALKTEGFSTVTFLRNAACIHLECDLADCSGYHFGYQVMW